MSSPTFCKRHQQGFQKEDGCPDCNQNKADRSYRGMNTTVWLDRNVVAVKPLRKDAAVQAELIVPKKNGH